VFNAKNISVMLVEESGVLGENHQHVTSYWQTITMHRVHLPMSGIWTNNVSANSGNRHRLYR